MFGGSHALRPSNFPVLRLLAEERRNLTEQGVAMLSTVINSERAIAVNIAIAIMAHLRSLRQILATHKQFAEELAAMDKKYDQRFKAVFDILKQLMERPPVAPKGQLGLLPPREEK